MDNDSNCLKILLILENVKNNINIINNLKEHFKILLSDNIIFSNKFNDIIDKIKFLNSESNKHLKSLKILEQLYFFSNSNSISQDDLVKEKIQTIESNINIIHDEIIKLVYEHGYNSISNIINIIDKITYTKYNIDIYDKIGQIEKFFRVIKVQKKNYLSINNQIDIKIKNIIIENNKKEKITSEKLKVDFDVTDDDKLKLNLIYELNKATIEMEIEDKLYIFDCYFKEDDLNELYNIDSFEIKYKNIFHKIIKLYDDNKLKIFYKEYMEQISVKDFIICKEEDIVEKIRQMYLYSNKLSKMSIIDLLSEFAENDIYVKRDIIILLLLDDNKLNNDIENDIINENNIDQNDDINKNKLNDFDRNIKNKFKINKLDKIINPNPIPLVKLNKATATRYCINSIMRNFDTNNEIKNLSSIITNSKKILHANILLDYLKNTLFKPLEYENFKNSIHLNLRRKIFAKYVNNSKYKITNETIKDNEISWETKLDFMEISEKAKDKVIEKIKEIRSASLSKDNVKAEIFVESFFKIPFGKYIKEDIFIKSENTNIKIKKLINKLNEYIINENELVYISDSLEQIKQKTISYRLINDLKSDIIENHYLNLVDEKKKINKEKQEYLNKVDKILEDAIYGHKESKREIKRLIAQWMNGKMEGTILGFHGPPGVGKTCFAKKGIAKCLFDSEGNSRPFCIFQLGGATDGSILEGHSYTYVGAKPGRLVEFLQETKCMNPIIYFDELDKVSETEKGKEIIDILIHLTDKSQNKELFDKYFSGIELDFSKCIIIFSYNDAQKINRILRDRITEIKINPLKKNEKIIITQNYTFKEISDELNFNCKMDDDLIEYLIDTYTFEPGIRKLNEKLYQIFREINLRILENPYFNLKIDKNLIDEILTRHYKIKPYKIHLKPEIGLVNGLYASTLGLGGITLIQIKKILTTANNIPLELTGHQGDVMKESMSCAKTLALNLLTNIEKESIINELKSNQFGLHIHCPDGATPKDGPSAGITITTCIYSILTNKKIRNDIAMTGEVDLLGNVKAIGGLDAKINGAIKAGIKLVIFPKENEQDWDKIIKENLLDGEIEFFMAETIDQVIQKAIIN